jgi:hypothetical protein
MPSGQPPLLGASPLRTGGETFASSGSLHIALSMPTSPLLDFYPWSYGFSLTRRTAVCGPACTVEWEGRTGNRLPYPDCARSLLRGNSARFSSAFVLRFVIATSPNLNWIPPNTRRGPVCICPCHIGGAAIHGVRCCEQGPGRLATMLTESILTPKNAVFVISYRSSVAAVTAAVKFCLAVSWKQVPRLLNFTGCYSWASSSQESD